MRLGQIKAQVMYSWNRKRNKNCKFLPGDKARVRSIRQRYSRGQNAKDGNEGLVLAVSTPNGFTIRGHHGAYRYARCYTNYYILFEDGEVYGFLSGDLEKI